MLDSCKMFQKQSEVFHTFLWHFFPSLKQNFIAYRSSKVSSCPDCIFEIHQLWQSSLSRVYSTSCCSCTFKSEIMKIGQSSHKVYSNNIVNFQGSTTILNVCTKKVWKLIDGSTYIGSSWSSCVYVKESTGVCCLWVHPYFSSNVPHVWIVFKMVGWWLYNCCFGGCWLQIWMIIIYAW